MSPVEVAEAEIGVEENPIGSNSGKEVNAYLASVGLPPGNSWCMAFVFWCFQQYFDSVAGTNPLIKTGGVLDQWHRIPDQYKVTVDPQAGDIFIQDHGHGLGHAGIVESANEDDFTINTIEGNSNTDGSRNGFEVVRHQRPIDDPRTIGYIRVPLVDQNETA